LSSFVLQFLTPVSTLFSLWIRKTQFQTLCGFVAGRMLNHLCELPVDYDDECRVLCGEINLKGARISTFHEHFVFMTKTTAASRARVSLPSSYVSSAAARPVSI
jgi:hypothetical protein